MLKLEDGYFRGIRVGALVQSSYRARWSGIVVRIVEVEDDTVCWCQLILDSRGDAVPGMEIVDISIYWLEEIPPFSPYPRVKKPPGWAKWVAVDMGKQHAKYYEDEPWLTGDDPTSFISTGREKMATGIAIKGDWKRSKRTVEEAAEENVWLRYYLDRKLAEKYRPRA